MDSGARGPILTNSIVVLCANLWCRCQHEPTKLFLNKLIKLNSRQPYPVFFVVKAVIPVTSCPIGIRISDVIFANVHVRAAFIRTSYIAGITMTDTCP